MKPSISLVAILLASSVLFAADPVPPDTVVAAINGRQVTAGELDGALAGAPPNVQEGLGSNRRQFLQQYALATHLAEMAEKEGLAESTPYKQQLEWANTQALWQAALSERNKKLSSESPETAKEAIKAWMDEVRDQSQPVLEDEEYFAASDEKARLIDPETVIATINEKKMTAGGIRDILSGASPAVRQRFRTNRKAFLAQYAMMDRLVQIAAEEKLDEQSPYKNQLAWVRLNTLMQAMLNHKTESINIGTKAQQEYYESHRDQFTQAKVKVLYVSFADDPASKSMADGTTVLTEADAKEKIDSIKKQLAEGADFVELVKEHSEDEASRAKDGDFGVIRRSDSVPEHIKQAVFALQAGGVSEVVRQPNGFYLFKAEEVGVLPLKAVLEDVMRDAKADKFQEWFTSVRDSIDIEYVAQEYFGPQGG